MHLVPRKTQRGPTILVMADHEELRDGIEALLKSDGYRISTARNEEDAIDAARRAQPDLILVSLDRVSDEVAASARRVRAHAGLSETIPIVIFCVPALAEGAEVLISANTWATRPASFNQLRSLLGSLIHLLRSPGPI